jgi:transcriptional regulator with XRE-family HTH domain
VFRKFGMTQAELAREIGVDRSKISLALSNEEGLINARDQLKLMKAARRAGIPLKAADLLPVMK